MPWTIANNSTQTCSFWGVVTGAVGSEHRNTVTATGMTNQGAPVSGQGSAAVTITTSSPDAAAGRAGDSPQDLIIITNAGAQVRWVYNGQPGQASSNPVSNPSNARQVWLPLLIRQR